MRLHRPSTYTGPLNAAKAGQSVRRRSGWPRSVAAHLGSLPRYNNTSGNPSANSRLTMMTDTKPIERKGWRSTSVTRRIGRLTYEQADDER